MQELQTETQDNIERTNEHFNGNVVTAGVPVTITTGTGRPIQLAFIYNPEQGVNANDLGDILYISWDGTNYATFPRGTSMVWPGKGFGTDSNQLKIDTNNNGTKYEIMLVS